MYKLCIHYRVVDNTIKVSVKAWTDTSQKKVYKVANTHKKTHSISLVCTDMQSKNHADIPLHAHTAVWLNLKGENQYCWAWNVDNSSSDILLNVYKLSLCKGILQHLLQLNISMPNISEILTIYHVKMWTYVHQKICTIMS